MNIAEITSLINASATVVAIIVSPFFAYRIARHQINQNMTLESHKAMLKLDAVREQTRFSEQWEKVAKAIVGVHSKLDRTFGALKAYVSPYTSPDGRVKQEDLSKLSDANVDFHEFYRENRIYLPASAAHRVEKIDSLFSELSGSFAVKVKLNQNQENANAEWKAIRDRVDSEVQPLLQDLESLFRRMLGIDSFDGMSDAG